MPTSNTMLTTTQQQTAEAIVNLFETGVVRGDYGRVTLIPGDTGQLSYGRSQVTLGSGTLFGLLDLYCSGPGAVFGTRLTAYLPKAEQKDPALNTDTVFRNLLRAASDDPVMRDTQDRYFDEHYFQSAMRSARWLGIGTPLGIAVVYDSRVHGSWANRRRDTLNAVGTPAQAGEQAWIERYVQIRKSWLENHSRSDLRRTVYRMQAFAGLIAMNEWALALPLVVRGAEISLQSLSALPPGVYDGPAVNSRTIALSVPLMRGFDVRVAQLGLSEAGEDVTADGIFGRNTRAAVERFQRVANLPATGRVDMAEFEALGYAHGVT